jgi:predicted DNA-binding protein (MmcQ/YjbR family)
VVATPDIPTDVLAELRTICLGLPETYEEQAWAGTRWCVRKKNFAHVVRIEAGWPAAYARVAGTDGPATMLTFRSSGDELHALTHGGRNFVAPPWAPNIVGMVLGESVDWDEVAELLTESYAVLAPKKLVDSIDRPILP